jgi:hypothetical protein
MKKLLLASALLCAASVAAQAEEFTFSGATKLSSRVMVPLPQSPAVGSMSTGETTTIYASGRKVKVTSKCSQQTRAPNDQFDLTGVCEAESDDGKFGLTFACNNVSIEQRTAMCWGILTGLTGSLKGKTGSVSWTGVANEDQSGTTAEGGGSWFD